MEPGTTDSVNEITQHAMPKQSQLVAQYQQQGFVSIPGFTSDAYAGELLSTTEEIAIRQVICGDRNVRFGEQRFGPEHPVARFFAADLTMRLVLALSGAHKVRGVRCWTSLYRSGEFINSHTDAAGDIHLIVCLQAPPPGANGGHLLLWPSTRRQITLDLRRGDAVAFEASSIPHCTTPINASQAHHGPLRVTAVGRYFTDVDAGS